MQNSKPLSIQATLRGIEKENLRVSHNGAISTAKHPKSLGHPLTHPKLTTDFAESQLEVITAPNAPVEQVIAELQNLYAFVHHELAGELLWPNSMPPIIYDCQKIPLADYGDSQEAQVKMTYRRALCYRYRRVMQIISGIHYNFSLPIDNRLEGDQQYFALIRNYFRNAWILPYLFGASPICATSSVFKEIDGLESYDAESYWAPYGTSLRLSDLGYQNKGQHLLNISFNSLEEYTDSLQAATQIVYPDFNAIGLYDAAGQRKQLNDHLLQIENEYYSPIRPKQIAQSGERPLEALRQRGVQYVEVRILDSNPLEANGLSLKDAAFIELFLLYCATQPTLLMSLEEHRLTLKNINLVSVHGRDPRLVLLIAGKEKLFTETARELLANMQDYFAQYHLPSLYQEALIEQEKKIQDVNLIPSQKILNQMQQAKQNFMEFNLSMAKKHQEFYLNQAVEDLEELKALAEKSWRDFSDISS